MTHARRILTLLSDGKPRTATDIAGWLTIKRTTARQTCHDLEQRGELLNVRSSRGPKLYTATSVAAHLVHDRNVRALAIIEDRRANHPATDRAWLDVLAATLEGKR